MKMRKRKLLVRRLRAWVPRKKRCPECGKRGPHWVNGGMLLGGFWTCAKFYGPDGRRL